MKKAYWSFFVILILCVIIAMLLFKIRHEKNNVVKSRPKLEDFAENTDLLLRQVRYNRRYDNLDLLFSLTDSTGRSIDFKDLCKDSPKFFFRFTEQNCNTCVDAEIKKLNRLTALIGKDNIIFLVSYSSNHAIQLLKRNYGFAGRIYNIDETKTAGWDVEKLNVPYFFLGDSSGISDFFIPEKDLPLISDIYYENIEKYFDRFFFRTKNQTNSNITQVKANQKTFFVNDIALNKPRSFTVHLTNVGRHPLLIAKVVPSCECMVSSFPKYPVAPNNVVDITITYNPTEPGRFIKTFDVFANAADNPSHFEINGYVKSK